MKTKQHVIDSPIGRMLFSGNATHIERACWISDEEVIAESESKADWLDTLSRQLERYFSGEKINFDLPLLPEGTDFQRQVWTELTQLNHGETTTYLKLGQKFGNKSMSQAVGGAVGANPLLLLIPCHRVLGTDGSLTGYAGGLKRKEYLLRLEGKLGGEQMELF